MRALTDLFLKVVNLSFSASWVVLAVLAARFALKKAPRWIHVFLWGLVALRLLCPFSPESALSLVPSAEVVSPEIMTAPEPSIHTGIDPLNLVVNEAISENLAPEPGDSANPLQIWISLLCVVWLLGMAAMAEYTLLTYNRLCRRVKMAIRVNANVYLSEHIPSPFVLGVFRPRIYLPYGMTETDMAHVIAHERTHIRRKDHWWKPLGFALLAVHWFNPLMWVAYILLCRDIELACDEKVIRELGFEARADYSQALLNCSVSHRSIAACPVAFGEVGVKARVKNVLTYRKPAFWVMVIAVILCVVVAVCFLTDPQTALIDRIVNQDGYKLLFQSEHPVELHIPNTKYPSQCYTVEGYTFGEKERPLGSHFGSNFYLKHMGYTDDTFSAFCFTISIDHLPEGNVVLTPCQVGTMDGKTTGTGAGLFIRTVYTENGSFDFDIPCTPVWTGEPDEFQVIVPEYIWRNAVTGITFTVEGFQKLFFQKDSAFGLITPRPITNSLTVENVDIAQATFWGDSVMHTELSREQIGELVYILNQLPVDDFEVASQPTHYISLMMLCGDREILLKTNGSYVWFTFDSETAANLDGDWMTQDEELIRFITGLSGYADAESFYGVSLTVEEVTPNGATVVFTAEGEAPAGRLLGGNDYWVQVKRDGVWEDVVKAPEPSFTTESYDVSNIRRHKIDWQWRYGTLSSGHYRIGKDVTYQEGSKPLETATVWAEFTLDSATTDAYAILSNLIPDGARAESTFASGGGYNCFPDEAEGLVQILNGIEESELMPSPTMTPTVSLILYANEEVTLQYNGVYVQFGFRTGENEALWAVKNRKLNEFFEMLLSHSPENSTYEIYNVAPLEDLPEHYSIEEATIDKVVIQVDGDISANADVWWEFLEKRSAGIPATVRVMHYWFQQDSRPAYKVIYELSFDGTDYTLSHAQDGILYTDRYKYLSYFHEEADESAAHDSAEYYRLHNFPGTHEELDKASSHDSFLIYTNLIYVPKEPELPWTDTLELRLNGQTLIRIEGHRQTNDLWELLDSAEYLGYEPKTYNLGPDIVLVDSSGNTATLNLDLDSDLFRYKGYFYDYGPGTNSNGSINNLPVLLGMLGLEDWPEEVKQAFPNYFAETGGLEIPPANDLFSDRGGKVVNVWYPDWAYLEILPDQANRVLEALWQEAPNPTDEPIPDVEDTVFTIHIAFDHGREFDLAYMGQTEFYLRDFQTNQVYTFSSEALRQTLDSAISETKAALYG